MAESKNKFSFTGTSTAAQQPTRQRFSFTGKTQSLQETQSLESFFPARQRLIDLARAPRVPVSPKVEFGVPETSASDFKLDVDSLTSESTKRETERMVGGKLVIPAAARETFQGTARGAASSGQYGIARALGASKEQATQLQIEPTGLAQELIFGKEPFSVRSEAVDPLIAMNASEGAAEKYGPSLLILLTAADALTGGGKRKLLQEALVSANTPSAARTVLRNAGITDEAIDTFKLDTSVLKIKTADEAAEFTKRLTESANKAKQSENQIVNTVRASNGKTSTRGASDIQPYRGAPVRQATPPPSTTGRFSFTGVDRRASDTAPRTGTPSPTGSVSSTKQAIRKQNLDKADESRFIRDEVLPSTPARQVETLKNLNTFGRDTAAFTIDTVRVGDGIVPPKIENNFRTIAGEIGLNTDKPLKQLVEDFVGVVDRDPSLGRNLKAPANFYYEQATTPGYLRNNPQAGFASLPDGLRKPKQTQAAIDVKNKINKTASSNDMIAIKDSTGKSTSQTTKSPTSKKTKSVNQRIDDVEDVKKWEENPVQAQADATKEVSKKYSNTDSSKGFVTDAVNHMDNVPPIKNVTAKARNHASKPDTPIDLPPETLRGWLQTRVQDSAYRLGLVQKNIVKAGGTISDEANAYLQREAYIGKAAEKIGRFEKKLGMVAGNKNGLLMRMRKDGITVDQLDEYMRAKAASARNARVASKTGGKVADGGSGLTNKQAQEILDKYKGNPRMQQYADEYRTTAINPKLQVLKEAGILTDEQIALITKGEPHYVPFKVEEFSRPQGGGKGFSVTSSGVKGLKGSARTDRTNAVFQGAVDYQEAVIRAEKNKSLQSLAKLIRENPDNTLWEIKGVQYTPNYNKYGEVEFLRKNQINEKTSVEFFENGKAYEIRFHDEALARVFTEQGLTKPIPGLIKINNYLRAVNTVINPEFMITNALRDLQTAMVTAGGEKGVVVAAKMVKDYPQASKGIWQAVRKESNTGWAKVYNEMVENGGRTGWFDLKEVGETTKEVSKRIDRYNSTKTSESLMRAMDSTGKLISDANEVFEMSVRTSAYKQLVDGGMSKTAAANYAKNMTVNFNKRGNWGMTLNSAYLFANAGIQGSARIVMALKYPKVRRIVAGIAATSYGLNELNMKLNPEGYERVQDFEKERNLIVMLPLDGNKYNIPGIEGDPGNGYYLKMPLPYGFNVFKVAGDAVYDVANKRKTTGEAMVQMIKAVDASFNPLSSGTPTQFITPTFLDPFVSSWENKNWFGAPIMPEQPAFAPEVRDSDRYFSGARDISVGTAQFLNRLTGGNEVTAGAVDISPETIDHVIDTLGGGLGNFIGQTIDGTINTVQGDIPTPDEMPFVRKLVATPFETGEQSQVFNLLEKSATSRMSAIEVQRFIDNTKGALERGQIDDATAKRVVDGFLDNAARQEAGEVLSLIQEGKIDQAKEVIVNAPPGVSEELDKLIEDDIEREIKKLERELQQ